MASERVLITGATGILGSFVLAKALEEGYRPVVLMRDQSVAEARHRLQRVLALTGSPEEAGAIEVIRSDVRQRFFNLPPGELARLCSSIHLVIHCAASVSFESNQDTLVWDTNVRGTHNLLEILTDAQVPLYYVSTAYVAGAHDGVRQEHTVKNGTGFTNVYERSKAHCEQLVRESMGSGRIAGAILRPSIIVGALKDGHIVQFLNFYGFLRIVDAIATGRLRPEGVTRFVMVPACTKNLVPADWTADAIWHIIKREGPSGRTYHLTNDDPPTQDDIFQWANTLLGGNMPLAMVPDLGERPTRLERVAHMQLRTYLPYMLDETRFDRSNTDRALDGALPLPCLRGPFFDLLLEYARERQWKRLFHDPAFLLSDKVPAFSPLPRPAEAAACTHTNVVVT